MTVWDRQTLDAPSGMHTDSVCEREKAAEHRVGGDRGFGSRAGRAQHDQPSLDDTASGLREMPAEPEAKRLYAAVSLPE